MMTDKTSNHREAILVIDSRGALSAVRNHSLGETWSKLYRVDNHYLESTNHLTQIRHCSYV